MDRKCAWPHVGVSSTQFHSSPCVEGGESDGSPCCDCKAGLDVGPSLDVLSDKEKFSSHLSPPMWRHWHHGLNGRG